MRKVSYLLLLAPSLLLAEKDSKEEPKPCWHRNSLVTVGGNYTRLNLELNDGGSLNGDLGGAHALYQWRPANSFYAALGFDWRQGSVDGSGGSQFILDVKGFERVGYNIEYNSWLCSIYTGFGFRYLGHHLRSSGDETFDGSFFPPFITHGESLRLNYYEFYVPVGFAGEYSFNSCFSLGLGFEWMPQVFPTLHIQPLGGAFWSLQHKIANFSVDLPFIFKVSHCGNWKVVVNPFYERWQDGHTTAKTSKGTPLGIHGNTYNFYGADLNIIYSF